jgi:hypothetical protein
LEGEYQELFLVFAGITCSGESCIGLRHVGLGIKGSSFSVSPETNSDGFQLLHPSIITTAVIVVISALGGQYTDHVSKNIGVTNQAGA